MNFLLYISEKTNPFQSIIVLSGAIFISSFFVISERRAVKRFLITLISISLILAFYLNIYSFISIGSFSNFLLSFENLQMIEVSIIIFSALNLLFFISMYGIDNSHFIKILSLFLFSTICAIFLAIARNFLLIFVTLVIFILVIFQLITALNLKIDRIRPYIMGYFLRPILTAILFFFGFSLFYGATDFKDFSQILQSEYISNPLIALGLIIFGVAVYLYFFLFPFQGPYMKLVKRNELSSNAVIWFSYFPVGIFMLMKLDGLYSFFIEKNNLYASIFLIIAFICILAGSIGAFKTNSIRRIISFLFLFFIGIFILNISMFSAGIITRLSMAWFNIANTLLMMFSFIPIYSIFSSIEKSTDSDSISNIRGFGRSNIYMGINLTVIFLSWLGFAYHIGPFIKYFSGTNFLEIGVINVILLLVIAIAFIFLLINAFRIIIQFFKKPLTGVVEKIVFPRFLYIYVTFFTLVILIAAIWGLLEILNVDIGIMNFKITELSF
ncbi:MAG TPA: hypothetical protein VIH13_01540 [Candidatus Hydromicrobium sp.]